MAETSGNPWNIPVDARDVATSKGRTGLSIAKSAGDNSQSAPGSEYLADFFGPTIEAMRLPQVPLQRAIGSAGIELASDPGTEG